MSTPGDAPLAPPSPPPSPASPPTSAGVKPPVVPAPILFNAYPNRVILQLPKDVQSYGEVKVQAIPGSLWASLSLSLRREWVFAQCRLAPASEFADSGTFDDTMCVVTGLQPSMTYFFRVYISNAHGVTEGASTATSIAVPTDAEAQQVLRAHTEGRLSVTRGDDARMAEMIADADRLRGEAEAAREREAAAVAKAEALLKERTSEKSLTVGQRIRALELECVFPCARNGRVCVCVCEQARACVGGCASCV